LQALKNHQYISPLQDVGNADLTAHVDFEAIGRAAEQAGARVFGPIEQGDFLKNIGIHARAEALKSRATPAQKFDIEKSLQRLTDPDQMGKLFKVMGLAHGRPLKPFGFDEKN
ncbi:MAG: SAM-dependent methyltransferase, partial [Alphaproteobacteria bacterium]